MSFYLVWGRANDPENPMEDDQVASTAGWADFGAWCDELPLDEFHELIQLAEWGEVDGAADLAKLEAQLGRAIDEEEGDPPADVLDTARRLLGLVKGRPEDADFLQVTDGSPPAEGDDEEDED